MFVFGINKNVWCYVDDIYVYLLVCGMDVILCGCLVKKESKFDEFIVQEDLCMNG